MVKQEAPITRTAVELESIEEAVVGLRIDFAESMARYIAEAHSTIKEEVSKEIAKLPQASSSVKVEVKVELLVELMVEPVELSFTGNSNPDSSD